MKFRHLVFAAAIALVVLWVVVELRAARGAGAVVLGKPVVQSLTAVPLHGEDGRLQAMKVTVTYLVDTLQPDGVTRKKELSTVSLDLVLQAHAQVIVAGKIMQLGESADDLMALADAAWAWEHPSELPQPRRAALREPGRKVAP